MADRRRKLAPLEWKRHLLENKASRPLHSLTQGVKERFSRLSPNEIGSLGGDESKEIWFPVLDDDPVKKAVRLLRFAAEIEHCLMVQYLYAGYGFRSSPNAEVLGVAIEEMSHLMTVQNLLKLVGAGPHLLRQDFGSTSRIYPFDLLLEPLSNVSLAKYVVAESPETLPAGVDPTIMSRIVNLAIKGAGEPINRVGTLYALMGAVFGSEQLLLQKAATGDPWYVAVNALAAEAATFYGGRQNLHLPDAAFNPGSAPTQGSDTDWDRSTEGSFDEFRVHVVESREEALEALRDIGLQGEGPSSVATEDAHFKRFYNLFVRLFGPGGMSFELAPGVAPVPSTAVIAVDSTSPDPNAISHADTVPWARLADLRYAVLLGSLEMYLTAPANDREYLRGWCFAEMFAIKILSRYLIQRPRNAGSSLPPAMAALPFNLPEWSGNSVTWSDLVSTFNESVTIAERLHAQSSSGSAEAQFLHLLQSSDRQKLAEATARLAGASVLRKSDRARDILDWVAGAGEPWHEDQGRFWNLPLSEFKQTELNGAKIVERPAGGGDALLIEVLRGGFMPMGRPSLTTGSPEFQFLENWVNSDCPDEPA